MSTGLHHLKDKLCLSKSTKKERERERNRVKNDKSRHVLHKPASFYNLFFKMTTHHFYIIKTYYVLHTLKEKKLHRCLCSWRQQSFCVISVTDHYRLPSDTPVIPIPPTKYTPPHLGSSQASSPYGVNSKYRIP